MSAPGSAKAPDNDGMEFEKKGGPQRGRDQDRRSGAPSPWQVWKQVLIGELLNVLERRRYDALGMR